MAAGAKPDLSHVHVVTEDHPWSERVPDHGGREETAAFRHAKDFVHGLIKSGNAVLPWGAASDAIGGIQMHHGGSIWVFDGELWHLYLNSHGSEYSGQFCIQPAKLESLRQACLVLVNAFPQTLDEMDRLGYPDGRRILNTPIVDADTISDYVDSVWNSQVPIPAAFHTGVLKKNAQFAGEHHYPKPVTDLQHLKWDDFELWVVDPQSGTNVAVTPTGRRGSGDARVKVAFAQDGTALEAEHQAARAKGEALVLPADSTISKSAFVNQT